MEVPTFSVVNWEKYQHYKDRTPPWIKLHAALLNNYDFACLQDASKAHLVLIWVLASQMGNRIPADPVWLGRRLGATSPIDLAELQRRGFIEFSCDASKLLAPCLQSACVETERETEREGEKESSPSGRTSPSSPPGGLFGVAPVVREEPEAPPLTDEDLRPHRLPKNPKLTPEQRREMQRRFDLWWEMYPRKVDKVEAVKIWMRLAPNADLFHQITEALVDQIEGEDWKRRMAEAGARLLPYPSTWLRRQRWLDEVEESPPPAESPTMTKNKQTAERALALLAARDAKKSGQGVGRHDHMDEEEHYGARQ